MNASTDPLASNLKGIIECEHPNENLHSFEGRLTLQGVDKPSPINMLHFVPRGSVLRNTDFVYAVCIYAGPDTKIMKNLKQGKLKSSSLEARLNTLVLWAFVYNAVLLVVSIILEYVFYNSAKSAENFQTDEFGYIWYLGFQAQDASYVSLSKSTAVILIPFLFLISISGAPLYLFSFFIPMSFLYPYLSLLNYVVLGRPRIWYGIRK
jgi:magnesium-transporting ATPase (P-type)